MADSCSETVDGEAVGGDCVKEQMTASQVQGDEMVECKDKEGSQREGVVAVHVANKQTSQTSMHVEQQNETLPFQRIPLENVAPRDEDGAVAGQSSDVACKVQAERQDSEITTSPSSVNSLLEETTPHSETTLNVSSGENCISMDELLSSTKSTADCDYASDQGLSMSDEIEMAQAAAPEPEPAVPSYYLVKWITWKEKKTPIITQSENGPCPLIAIMNILFLRWKVILPAQTEVVTIEELMAHLGECVLSIKPREKVEGMELNFQQNMSDAMAVLPKLSTGLDVNVRFTGVTDFEYTPECIVFDLLDIPLYHGWLVDPQSPEMVAAVGKLSYNQLVEKIIEYKHSTDCVRVSEGLTAEQFLESTATQLSYHGLCELNTTAKEGELSVFFRNNHFSTMIKHKGYLYLLVTDQGFLQEDSVIWESLHNVEGDGNFCDSDFRLCHPAQKPAAATTAAASQPTAQEQQLQIDQDYLVAMSLQQGQAEAPGPLSDLELARQLQQEEYQQPQQRPHASSEQMRSQAAPHHGGRRRPGEKKEDSDCCIL